MRTQQRRQQTKCRHLMTNVACGCRLRNKSTATFPSVTFLQALPTCFYKHCYEVILFEFGMLKSWTKELILPPGFINSVSETLISFDIWVDQKVKRYTWPCPWQLIISWLTNSRSMFMSQEDTKSSGQYGERGTILDKIRYICILFKLSWIM